MSKKQLYRIPDMEVDGVSILMEAVSDPSRDDRSDVGFGDTLQKITDAVVTFEKVSKSVKQIADQLMSAIKDGDWENQPSETKVDFALKLAGSSNLVIVEGSGEANLRVSMTWKRDDQSQPKQ